MVTQRFPVLWARLFRATLGAMFLLGFGAIASPQAEARSSGQVLLIHDAGTGHNVLYGTTVDDGAYLNGTVYSYDLTTAAFTVLCSFGASVNDGTVPNGGVITDGNGNFYGTTRTGGSYGHPPPQSGGMGGGYGTIFQVTKSGVKTILYSFPTQAAGYPCGKLLLRTINGVNVLIGTASGSLPTATYGLGSVFKVNADGTGFTTLHTFAGLPNDGAQPYGELAYGSGYYYGVTSRGGNDIVHGAGSGYSDSGTAFRLSATAPYQLTLIHSMNSDAGNVGFYTTEGPDPLAGVSIDSSGTIYGTCQGSAFGHWGGVWKITNPSSTAVFSVLVPFGGYAQNMCHAAHPWCTPFVDGSGNIWGTTYGGSSGGSNTTSPGSLWRTSPNGGLTVLFNFDSPGINDGGALDGGVQVDSSGNVYGTAGSLFQYSPTGVYTKLHSFS